MKRFLNVSPSICRGCQTCVFACAAAHEHPSGLRYGRIKIKHHLMEHGNVSMTICRHCPRPRCVEKCPTGAIAMGDDGVVRIDGELCIACGACARNCPFDAITVLREEGFSIKCDLCETRVGGRGPACVEVCPVVAVRLIERE